MSWCNRPRSRLGRAVEQLQVYAVLALLAGFGALALVGLLSLIGGRP